jgi:hypothetical protein
MKNCFFIALISCLFLQACKNNATSLDKVVREMAAYGIYEYPFVGLTAEPSLQWARYQQILNMCSDQDLVELCGNESPVVRCYAFQGLIDKGNSKVFDQVITHIHDTASFDKITGCMNDPCYVSDFYLEQVSYFPYDTSTCFRITAHQRNMLDSLMLYGDEIALRMVNVHLLSLRSRAYLLSNLSPKGKFCERLRTILDKGVTEALPALAKYRDTADINRIELVYNQQGWPAMDFVFDAIINFPDPALFQIVENEVKNDLSHNNAFYATERKYYKALSLYNTPAARKLLSRAIAETDSDDQQRRSSYVKYLISRSPDTMVYFKNQLTQKSK